MLGQGQLEDSCDKHKIHYYYEFAGGGRRS